MRAIAIVLLAGLHGLFPLRAAAQAETAAQAGTDMPPSDTAGISTVTPGGAFLRSLAIPGWGQAEAGSYERGGFYFLTSAATGWMLFKTGHALGRAEERKDVVESEIEAALRGQGITNPDTLRVRIEGDPQVQELSGLVESRSQQMEDWTAFGIFWLLLNAADAFVSAHLADFPEPVEIDVRGGLPGSAAELKLTVPLGR